MRLPLTLNAETTHWLVVKYQNAAIDTTSTGAII
jgi:hypothetical protein